MDPIVGIDLGTTNSLVGCMEAGFAVLIADAQGERLTPSVVHFSAGEGVLVGREAERERADKERERAEREWWAESGIGRAWRLEEGAGCRRRFRRRF